MALNEVELAQLELHVDHNANSETRDKRIMKELGKAHFVEQCVTTCILTRKLHKSNLKELLL